MLVNYIAFYELNRYVFSCILPQPLSASRVALRGLFLLEKKKGS